MLILVDDGSTDDSGVICDSLAKEDSRIKVIHQHNAGASVARNTGLRYAKGKYITFMDADDILTSPLIYETVIDKLEKNPDLDIIQFDTIFSYGTSKQHKRNYPFKRYSKHEEIFAGYLTEQIHVACWDKIFRREVFDGVSFPAGQTAEDIAIIPQIIENCSNLETINCGYYGYVYSPDSTSNSVKSLEHIVSILRSYYMYCNSAFKYSSNRALATEVYTGQLWMYLSVIQTDFPTRVKEFLTNVSVIKLPVFEIIKAKVSIKRKLQMLAIAIWGEKGLLLFQRLVTRRYH